MKGLNRALLVSLILLMASFTGGMSAIVIAQNGAPSVTLNSFPNYTNDPTPTFTGTATATAPGTNIVSVEYMIDSGSWISIADPNGAQPVDGAWDEPIEDFTFTTTTLSNGFHTIKVRAIDTAYNVTDPAKYATFTVDTIAPSIALTSLSPDPTNDNTPTLSGTATDATSPITSVKYRVDNGAWIAATAIDGAFNELNEDFIFTMAKLADGEHLVQAKATDAAGNASPLASDTFTVDTTPLSLTLNTFPTHTNDPNPAFSGTATDTLSPITSVQYRIDSGAWTAAVALDGAFDELIEEYAFTTTALADGLHTVKVRAGDALGNTTTPADYATATFTVDTIAPSVALTPPSPDPTNDNTPTLSGTATDATSPITSVEYRVDGGDWITAEASNGTFDELSEDFIFTMAELGDGEHLVQVRATDTAENASLSASYTFTVDTTLPSLTLNPFLNYTNDNTPTLSGTATDATSPITSVEYRVNDGDWIAAEAINGTFDELSEDFTFTMVELADGQHLVQVRATDAAENVSPLASRVFTMDTTAPSLILNPFPDYTNDNTLTLSGLAIDTTSPINLVEYRVDSGDWIAAEASNGTFDEPSEDFAFTMAELDDGEHLVEVRATDAVGNVSLPASHTFTVDATPPSLTLNPFPSYTNDPTPAFSGTATDTLSPITSVQYRLDGGAWIPATAVDDVFDEPTEEYYLITAMLADGPHTIEVRAWDVLGNTTTPANYATVTFIVDTTPPSITLTPLFPDPTNDNTLTISGTAIDTTSLIASAEYSIDNGDWVAAEAINGTFDELSEGFTFTTAILADGSHTVQVRAWDAAGNITTLASDTFIVDTALPSVTIDDIPDSVSQLASISGTASDNPPGVVERVQVLVNNSSDGTYWDGVAWVTLQRWLDAAGTGSWSYNMPTLTDGKAYTVKAKSIDSAGNDSIKASDSFTFDTTPPVVPQPPSPEEDSPFLAINAPWLWLLVSGACGLTLVMVLIRRGKAKV
jgi:hypothetical protein